MPYPFVKPWPTPPLAKNLPGFTKLQISFAVSLQESRQARILEIIGALAKSPRFEGKLTSLLDVGCGEGELVRACSRCSDKLPFSVVTGIDNDAELPVHWDFTTDRCSEYRWRPLDLYMLLGSFEKLDLSAVGYHDVVVSSEGWCSLRSFSLSLLTPSP